MVLSRVGILIPTIYWVINFIVVVALQACCLLAMRVGEVVVVRVRGGLVVMVRG